MRRLPPAWAIRRSRRSKMAVQRFQSVLLIFPDVSDQPRHFGPPLKTILNGLGFQLISVKCATAWCGVLLSNSIPWVHRGPAFENTSNRAAAVAIPPAAHLSVATRGHVIKNKDKAFPHYSDQFCPPLPFPSLDMQARSNACHGYCQPETCVPFRPPPWRVMLASRFNANEYFLLEISPNVY